MAGLNDKRVLYGLLSSISLLAFYFAINYYSGGLNAVYWNFRNYYNYIAVIDVGFGLQMALFTHIRSFGKSCNAVATTSVTGGSMVACCLHHITDFIPFLGVGAGLFLSQFTEIFFMIGSASSLIGVIWMLSIIQKNEIYPKSGPLSKIMQIDYSILRDAMVVISAVVILWKYISTPYTIF